MNKKLVFSVLSVFLILLFLDVPSPVRGAEPTHRWNTDDLCWLLPEGSRLFFDVTWIELGDGNGLFSWIDDDTLKFYNLVVGSSSCPNPWEINMTGSENVTVIRLFVSDVLELNVNTSASSGLTKVTVGGFGEPTAVTGADSWGYDSGVLSLTVNSGVSNRNVTVDWGNSPPTNDGCVSTTSFDVDVYGWVNMTVSDLDGVSDLKTVDIEVTGVDSKVFTLRWTQSTNVFSELSDPDSVCTLDVSGSVRENVDSDTDKIAFRFKVSAVIQKGLCDVESTVTDDSDDSDVDSYLDDFTINFYSSLTVNTASHSWSVQSGDNDILINEGAISLTITANGGFDVQVKGDGDLADNGNSIPLGNVKVHADTLGSAISLTVSYADVGGLTGQGLGVDLNKSFALWLSVPDGCPSGAYVYVCSVQVVES